MPKHEAGWVYIVNSLFYDRNRAVRVFPFMSPDSIDLCFLTNSIESYHAFLKHWFLRQDGVFLPCRAELWCPASRPVHVLSCVVSFS
jgi:hypothetical protein